MEQSRNNEGRRYAFHSAQWHKWQKIAIIQIICSDGRMLRLFVRDATKKWCKYYKSVIDGRANKIIRNDISKNVQRWTRLTIDSTVGTMQGDIDKWQAVAEQ